MKGMPGLTQSVSASKGHLTHITLVRFLLRMGAYVIGELVAVTKSLGAMAARKRID